MALHKLTILVVKLLRLFWVGVSGATSVHQNKFEHSNDNNGVVYQYHCEIESRMLIKPTIKYRFIIQLYYKKLQLTITIKLNSKQNNHHGLT